jgi:hypothetical protein
MRAGTWLAALALLAAGVARAEQEAPFRLFELPGPGRTGLAGLADLDGDGRTDVYALSLFGIPPRARRELRVHFQSEDGAFRKAPDWTGAVVGGAAAFDVADLFDGPGREILLLRRHRVSVLSFAGRELSRRDLMIPGDPTAAAAPDERGLDRLRLVRTGLTDQPVLLVPGLGECVLLTPRGEVLARLEVGDRANYFIQRRPGPLVGESELESYYDFPRLEVGDVDGDGRADVIAATRHEIRVFRQREGGHFADAPDRRLPLGRLSERDLIRGSGNVRVAASDLNGDGRVDLVVAATTGGLVNARSETTVHMNRGGNWNLDDADRRSVLERGWTAIELVDLDGDGRPELVEAAFPFSILETVETLLTREADVEVTVFRAQEGRLFEEEPWIETSLHVGLDFETFGSRGFVPTLAADVNGDGLPDRLEGGDGTGLDVYLGGGASPLRKRVARQSIDSRGSIRFGDIDGDGLTDAILFSRDRPDAPLRILVNRGVLPGTPRRPILVPAGG